MIESRLTSPMATGNVPSPDEKQLPPLETEDRDSFPAASRALDVDDEERRVDEPAIDPAVEPGPDTAIESSPPPVSETPAGVGGVEPAAAEQATAEQATAEQAIAEPATAEPVAPDQETGAMADPAFAELLEQSLEKVRTFRPGDRLRGVVQRIDDSFAYLDYGGPREAVIAAPELRDGDGNLTIGVGERIDVTVGEVRDQLVVHRLVRKTRDRSVLKQAFASGAAVEAKITGINKGGFEVQVAGFRAFCPISQIDRLYCTDQQAYIGQTLPFRIIEYKEGGRRVVVSRRVLLEEDRRREAAETRARLAVGDELEGTVVRIQPFGAFVDIGGLDGLVHVSELRHGRVTNPAQVVRVGQKLRVKVIGIENLGVEKGERISLSARALEADPWLQVGEDLRTGASVEGKVLRLMNYGAFVEVLPGVEGLLHLSEMGGDKRLHHPREAVTEGSMIEVRVLEFDRERRRLSLSTRSADAPRPEADGREARGRELVAGMQVEGAVSSVKPYGVFVRIREPVSGIDGLLPVEETGLPRGTNLGQALPVGSAVRADVLRVDALGRVRLTQRPASEREVSTEQQGSYDRETSREHGSARERGTREHRGGRDRGALRGTGQETDSGGGGGDEREARRGPRRGQHKETRSGAPRDPEEGEEERREAKSGSSSLGIMAKAFRRVLDTK